MSDKAKTLVVGNWKMNGTTAALAELRALADLLAASPATCTVGVCPPATLVMAAAKTANRSSVLVGGQDCHAERAGAHTGDISAEMLGDAGAALVIVGHSERRADYGESDALVCSKAEAAIGAGLLPIICVGETEIERRLGQAVEVVSRQLGASVPAQASAAPIAIAYEPVWAIGTGLTPTLGDIEEMHATMRRLLVGRFGTAGDIIPLLYGGSVKPGNAREILALREVNGALVGGASLLANDFFAIISAAG